MRYLHYSVQQTAICQGVAHERKLITIVIPCLNEQQSISTLYYEFKNVQKEVPRSYRWETLHPIIYWEMVYYEIFKTQAKNLYRCINQV